MNKEALRKDQTTLVPLSDDVAERKRGLLRNFLAQSFPECLSEGRINFETLRRALGEWVEAGNERFGLVWPGKAQCTRIIQQASAATLKPDRGESVSFESTDNVFIEGDNLEVLKLLQKAYFGKIKMIYIDLLTTRGGSLSILTNMPKASKHILRTRGRLIARDAGFPPTPIRSAGITRTG